MGAWAKVVPRRSGIRSVVLVRIYTKIAAFNFTPALMRAVHGARGVSVWIDDSAHRIAFDFCPKKPPDGFTVARATGGIGVVQSTPIFREHTWIVAGAYVPVRTGSRWIIMIGKQT